MKFSATAKIQMTVEMPAGSSWGKHCTLDQINDQAGRETITKLKALLAGKATIVGEPTVLIVTAQRNES